MLEQVVTVVPDMTEVFTVITRMKKQHPETGLLEVIGPVFCNTTRHFLLIQVSGEIALLQCSVSHILKIIQCHDMIVIR